MIKLHVGDDEPDGGEHNAQTTIASIRLAWPLCASEAHGRCERASHEVSNERLRQ